MLCTVLQTALDLKLTIQSEDSSFRNQADLGSSRPATGRCFCRGIAHFRDEAAEVGID